MISVESFPLLPNFQKLQLFIQAGLSKLTRADLVVKITKFGHEDKLPEWCKFSCVFMAEKIAITKLNKKLIFPIMIFLSWKNKKVGEARQKKVVFFTWQP